MHKRGSPGVGDRTAQVRPQVTEEEREEARRKRENRKRMFSERNQRRDESSQNRAAKGKGKAPGRGKGPGRTSSRSRTVWTARAAANAATAAASLGLFSMTGADGAELNASFPLTVYSPATGGADSTSVSRFIPFSGDRQLGLLLAAFLFIFCMGVFVGIVITRRYFPRVRVVVQTRVETRVETVWREHLVLPKMLAKSRFGERLHCRSECPGLEGRNQDYPLTWTETCKFCRSWIASTTPVNEHRYTRSPDTSDGDRQHVD